MFNNNSNEYSQYKIYCLIKYSIYVVRTECKHVANKRLHFHLSWIMNISVLVNTSWEKIITACGSNSRTCVPWMDKSICQIWFSLKYCASIVSWAQCSVWNKIVATSEIYSLSGVHNYFLIITWHFISNYDLTGNGRVCKWYFILMCEPSLSLVLFSAQKTERILDYGRYQS